MIDASCDGRRLDLPATGPGNLGELLKRAEGVLDGRPRVLVAAVLDGVPVADADLTRPESVALAGVGRVELRTETVHALALRSLATATATAGELQAALGDIAGALRAGSRDAEQLVAAVGETLSVIVYTVQAAADALGSAGEPLLRFGAALEPWVAAAADARERRDWVGVADLLQYEIEPLVASVPESAESVRRALPAG